MNRVTASAARDQFSDLVNKAMYAKDRTIVTRHNTDVAAIIPIEELHLLDRVRAALVKLEPVPAIERELSEARERAAVIEFAESACEETLLTSESFLMALGLIEKPPRANQALRDLMAAHGD